ncbi:hypothetical protein QFC21_007350 [Naganishia friedmannii]|uniref:Uncharacterized protein n=1 Tax=Naganishia friedmannii TaxID=89922 RepID=A0ACC2UVR3_9TREE|nr:hypothetical protein QFC21_007350 [Naganishia friedmannii]
MDDETTRYFLARFISSLGACSVTDRRVVKSKKGTLDQTSHKKMTERRIIHVMRHEMVSRTEALGANQLPSMVLSWREKPVLTP